MAPDGIANLIRHAAMRMTEAHADGQADQESYQYAIKHLTRFARTLLVHAAQLDGFIEALEELDDAEHELRGARKTPDEDQAE